VWPAHCETENEMGDHHDDWNPPVTSPTDVEPIREELFRLVSIERKCLAAKLPLQFAQDTPKERRAVAGTALDWIYRPAPGQSWRAGER